MLALACVRLGRRAPTPVPPKSARPAPSRQPCPHGAAGLYVIPGALGPGMQRQLIVDALTRFPLAPACTNFTQALGLLPPQPGLWEAARQELFLLRLPQRPGSLEGSGVEAQGAGAQHEEGREGAPGACSSGGAPACGGGCARGGSASGGACDAGAAAAAANVWGPSGGGAGPGGAQPQPAPRLLRKLRWAALGPPYDWTRRAYCWDAQYLPLPQYLADLAVQLAAAVQGLGSGGSSSAGGGASGAQHGSPFRPNAALVNYYCQGGWVGGPLIVWQRAFTLGPTWAMPGAAPRFQRSWSGCPGNPPSKWCAALVAAPRERPGQTTPAQQWAAEA